MAIPTSAPIIYQSDPNFSPNSANPSLKDKLRSNGFKLVLGALLIGIIIEVIIGIKTLTTPFPKPADATNSVGVGKIVLDSPKDSFNIGETIPVTVRIVTSGRATDSTDLILKYDPIMLESTGSAIETGKIYSEYVIKEVDPQNGEIRISAITPPNTEGFVGIGDFAKINFKALQTGSTELAVDFSKGSTIDSNLVETGVAVDILDQVYNLGLKIGDNSAPGDQTPPTTSCDGYYQYCHNLVGQTGRQFCKKGRLIENSCVFDPKLSTSCDICRLGY